MPNHFTISRLLVLTLALAPAGAVSSVFSWLSSRAAAPAAHEKRAQNGSYFWVPEDFYEGKNFFDAFDFWSAPDLTHGQVNYLNREAALGRLAYVDADNRVVMAVDNSTVLQPGQNRDSVRISTKKRYTHGLFLFDVEHSPFGCSVWPAWWTTSNNWPAEGEIDIIEGVHDVTHNQVAWHTTAGCMLTVPGNFTGSVILTDCDADKNSNSGCAIRDASRSSYGSPFSGRGGGIYAMKWDEDSIDTWFFYRQTIPQDIRDQAPDPRQWGMPGASLSAKGCPIDKYFKNHVIVINITLCGDWAGSSYATSGCPGTCSDRVADPNNYLDAYWSINYLRVYKKVNLAGPVTNEAKGKQKALSSALVSWTTSGLALLTAAL